MMLYNDLKQHGLELCGALSLKDCDLCRPELLIRAGFDGQALSDLYVLIFAVPYLTPAAEQPHRNLSSYAVSRDYHLFFRTLFDTLIPKWKAAYPGHRFAGFADHSPIDEIEAAVRAGLGLRGRNHLLLTQRHSSYVFLGEIITDLPLPSTKTALPENALHCHNCEKCLAACPMARNGGLCRSALTQKKGELTDEERASLSHHPLLWGCDTCQEVCPYTSHARNAGTLYTTIPFFLEHTDPYLTIGALDAMKDDDFSQRAYAWRGKAVIRRNLLLKSTHQED